MSNPIATPADIVELMEAHPRLCMYVGSLKARIEELEAHVQKAEEKAKKAAEDADERVHNEITDFESELTLGFEEKMKEKDEEIERLQTEMGNMEYKDSIAKKEADDIREEATRIVLEKEAAEMTLKEAEENEKEIMGIIKDAEKKAEVIVKVAEKKAEVIVKVAEKKAERIAIDAELRMKGTEETFYRDTAQMLDEMASMKATMQATKATKADAATDP